MGAQPQLVASAVYEQSMAASRHLAAARKTRVVRTSEAEQSNAAATPRSDESWALGVTTELCRGRMCSSCQLPTRLSDGERAELKERLAD